MAALEARSLLTRETIPSPDARYPNRVGGIVRMVGGLRLEWWAPSRQNDGRHQIGIGGRLTSESANLLLDLADADGIAITNLALQKLLYFAHGHFLIQTGGPLMQGAFEAWNNGPVHAAVYHAFKLAGREQIRQRAIGRNIMTGETRTLKSPRSEAVRAHIGRMLKAYGRLSPRLLVAISHAPRGPWAVVRDRAMTATALGARIPDSLTLERFRFQAVIIGLCSQKDALDDDAPLSVLTVLARD